MENKPLIANFTHNHCANEFLCALEGTTLDEEVADKYLIHLDSQVPCCVSGKRKYVNEFKDECTICGKIYDAL